MLTSAAARLGLLLVLGVCTQGEEAAPADVQATLDAMHEWSRSIDSPQLLQAMAQGETAAVLQIHDKASSIVQQLEQQLQQVTEPVAVSWLKASAYDTYALLLRTKDWLSSRRDLHAAQTLADLVKVGKERTLHSAGCLAYGLNSRRAGLDSKG